MAYALAPAPLATARIATPVGTVMLTAAAGYLTAVTILPDQPADEAPPADALLRDTAHQFAAYFAGRLRDFDVPLAPLASARGMALRDGIAAISYGTTITYGMLASLLGSGPRAIGQACRRNPLPIIIPCHRVTSAAGPEYYSGGSGAVTKGWLNDFESSNLSSAQRTRLL